MRAYILVMLSLALSQAEASDRIFKYAESARGAELPFYAAGESRPYAALRVGRVFKDYERRGFFRIGLLPVLVADDVTLRLLEPERTTQAFGLAGQLTTKAANAVEWRDVKLVFGRETTARLRAARMRPSPDGGWRIWDAVAVVGTNGLAVSEGQLFLKGGHLILSQSGGNHITINVPVNPG